MPLDYSSVRRQYDLLYGAGVTKKSMPEWAAEMNSLTSSNLYDRGTHDGWWTRVSNWADENIFHPVADVTTAPLGAAIGNLFGNEEVGREVGRSLPRTLLETAPAYLAGPEVGIPATAALLAAHTYADTGSGKAAAISGSAGIALPLVGRFTGPLVARAFGTAERVAGGEFAAATETAAPQAFSGGWFPKAGSETGFKLASLAGSQAGQVAVGEAQMYGESKVLGTPFDPLSPAFLAQQIPFTVFDAVHTLRAKVPTTPSMEARRIVPQEKPEPEYVAPPSPPEQQAQVEALFSRLQEVTSPDSTASPEERAATLAAAIKGVNDPTTVQALKTFGKTGEMPQVEVTGWGKQLESGSWKLVVDPKRSQGVEVPEHGNVFVNEKNATRNPDGSVSIRTTLDKVNGRVQYPLRPSEVRPDLNQPNLPVQKNGLAPDEQRIFEKVGVKPPETPTPELRPIAQQIEQTHQTLANAREKIATVPKTAEEVAKSVFEIPTVEAISKATKLVGEDKLREMATKELVGLEKMNPEDAKAYALEVSARNVLEERQKGQIAAAIDEGHNPTQAVTQATLAAHTPVVDSSLEQQNVLKAKAEKVVSTDLRGKPQAQYGEPVRDETGKNFQTRALAEAYREADPDLSEHVVRDAGQGKGFYLAPQINKEVSLEGTNLEAVLADSTPVDSRPDVSIQDVVGVLDRAGANLDTFDELLGNNDIGQTLKEIQFTKKFLQKTLAGEKISLDDAMRKVVSKVTQATGEWNTRFRSWDLESSVPHDEALVQKIGIREGGLRAGLDWYVNHPQSGPLGEFVGGLLKAADANGVSLSNVDFIQDQHVGWSYDPFGRNGKPEITYPSLPASENAAFIWATKGAHEAAHHFGDGILRRADPQSVKFRSTLNQVIQALEKSELLPKKVLSAVATSKKEGWYEDFRQAPTQELYDKFVKAAGEENRKWFGTFYAMHNEHELFANMFEDHDLVDMLVKTKMPQSKTQTVLQWFSQAWNKLFGNGKVEQDNALHQILTGFEDYLSGPKLAQRTLDIRPNLSAGEGFFYGMAPYDPTRNTIGDKHALPKSGIVSTKQFKSIGGVWKPLADAEIELYKNLVPEAFTSAGNVNVPKLVEGLKTKGMVVEVRKLRYEGEQINVRAQAQHELETMGYQVRQTPTGDWNVTKNGNPVVRRIGDHIDDLIRQVQTPEGWGSVGGRASFQFVAPKPESEMPGYVEGLVRVPLTPATDTKHGEVGNQLYRGPHFGSEDTNVLSFYRGYEETLPDGTKAFHVIEVQSDWAQRNRDAQQQARQAKEVGRQTLIGEREIPHPLLKVYESLALKAAIQHAKEVGASKVILSDAETAMMTEGHDRAAIRQYSLDKVAPKDVVERIANEVYREQHKIDAGLTLDADGGLVASNGHTIPAILDEQGRVTNTSQAPDYSFRQEVFDRVRDAIGAKETTTSSLTQEKGMRLHYDQTLPSAMEKLTGVKGVKVEVGVHKSTQESYNSGQQEQPIGSPVFHDASGNPKTQVTGRVYDISKVPSDQTLFDSRLTTTQVKNPSLYNGRDYLRDALIAKGVRPEGLASRIDSVEKLFSTGDLAASLEGFQREQTAETLPATTEPGAINPNFQTALLQGTPTEIYQSVKNLLADEVPVHQDLWARLRQDVVTAQELRRNIEKGYVPGSVPEGLEEKLRQAFTRINAMKNGLEKQDVAIQGFKSLLNFTVDGMENSLAGQLTQSRLPAAHDPTGLEDVARDALSFVDLRKESSRAELEKSALTRGRDFLVRNLMFTQFSKQQVPGFRPVADHVQQEQGEAFMRMARLNLVRSYDPDTQAMSKKIIQTNQRVEQNPNLARAASDIRRWIQLQNKEGKTWSLDDPFVKDVLGRSGDPEAIRTELRTELARRDDLVKQVMPTFLAKYNQKVVAFAIAARETGMKPTVAEDLSSQMMQSLGLLKDPTTAPYGLDTLRMLSGKMQADTYLKTIGLAKELIDGSQKHLDFMASTPGYTTEQRFDKHHIVMVTPDQKPYRASYGTRDAALVKVKELEAKGYKFLDYVPKSDANVPGGIQEGVINAMKVLDTQAAVKLQNALADKPDILAQVLPMTQRANDYEASQAAFSPLPGTPAPRRQFIGGREEINMVTNSNLMYIKLNNWMRHKLVRASSDLDMLDPELQGNKVALDYSRQHVENQLSLDNPLTRKIIEATYNWKLAWNFGVNFLHGIQSLTTGMSSMVAETNSVGDAFALTAKAQKSVVQRNTTGKWDTPEHEWLANNLAARGHAGIASWSDFIDIDRGNLYDAGKAPGVVGFAINTVKNAARSWTGMFLRFNDQIGAIAAFDLGREQGMSQEDALNYAIDVKNRGYFTGGKSQRAVGLWSIKTKPIPQLMSSLQGYTFGWFSQLMNNYVRGFGKPDVALSETERSGARKAFIYSLSAQAVMAGAIGLPGVGQGLALVKQTTGFDTKGWLRQHLADFFGEDQDNGGLMTSLALHGAVASFTPIDPSGRHMPTFPFTGISPYKGFDISNLATAPVSAVVDVVRGLMAAAKGDMQGATTLLPHVLQGPFQLLEGEGDIRDKRGGLTYQLSPAERFITALGMTPSRVQVAKDTVSAVKDLQAAQTQQKEHLVDELATSYRKEGPTSAQAKLVTYLQDNPKENGPGLVREVASQVRKQTLPYDYRREVSPKVDLAGLGSRMPSSEVAGRNLEYDVQKNLGLLPRFNIRGDLNAVTVDQLLDSNPYLSRSEALRQVSEKSRVPRLNKVLNFQQPQSLFQ